MVKRITFPGRYIQGPGVINKIGKYVTTYGKKALILGSPSGLKATEEAMMKSLAETNIETIIDHNFGRECSYEEVNRLANIGSDEKADIVIGVGGGKALDTAKAVAHKLRAKTIIMPTVASSDAACTAVSVMYTPNHVFKGYQFYSTNPDLIAVDTNVIARSPVRLLISGMGDALATWWESNARASVYAKGLTCGGSRPGHITMTALTLARLCYDTLLECGVEARRSCEGGVSTPALEEIVEANTLLSSVAVENTGTAAAHSIYDGFTILGQRHKSYHGEVVAFGTVVQLILEGQPEKDLYEVINFCDNVGLPYTLADMNLADITDKELMEVAKRATDPAEFIHGYTFPVTPESVFDSIRAADSMGIAFKERK